MFFSVICYGIEDLKKYLSYKDVAG